MTQTQDAVIRRAMELARAFRTGGEELRDIAGDMDDHETLRRFLLDVMPALRVEPGDPEFMLYLFAYNLVVDAFDPRRVEPPSDYVPEDGD
jgi:hypothetical protein